LLSRVLLALLREAAGALAVAPDRDAARVGIDLLVDAVFKGLFGAPPG
jgi:hypothetical protein